LMERSGRHLYMNRLLRKGCGIFRYVDLFVIASR
jgi:hypothetical protein